MALATSCEQNVSKVTLISKLEWQHGPFIKVLLHENLWWMKKFLKIRIITPFCLFLNSTWIWLRNFNRQKLVIYIRLFKIIIFTSKEINIETWLKTLTSGMQVIITFLPLRLEKDGITLHFNPILTMLGLLYKWLLSPGHSNMFNDLWSLMNFLLYWVIHMGIDIRVY